MTALEQLTNKRAQVLADIDALKASVAAANRAEFNELEQEQLSGLLAAAEQLTRQIDLHKATEALQAQVAQPEARVVTSTTAPANVRPVITGGTLASANSGNSGFTRGFTEFLSAVRNAAFGRTDQRLLAAVTTYGGVGTGADGGFAVPPDFAARVTEIVVGEESLVAKFNPIMTAGNQVVLPTDETTPYGTSGIYGEWLAEAGAFSDRKPVLKQTTVNLHKVGCMVQLSDELLQDAPAIESHVMRKIGAAITAKVNNAIVAGTGVAQPLGMLSAPGLVTVTKSASTLAAIDLANMLSRMLPASVNNAFWLCHTSVLPYIWTLTLGQVPVYQQDFRQSPYGALLSRPIFTTEFCSDYNTLGDLFLVSPDGYAVAVKAGGVQTAASIHFAFNQDVNSFRAVMRVGGTPLASGTVARKNGSNTLSHIVAMGVRS